MLKSPLAHEPFTGGSLDRIGNSQCIANAIKNDIGEMSVESTLIGSENRDGIWSQARTPPRGVPPTLRSLTRHAHAQDRR